MPRTGGAERGRDNGMTPGEGHAVVCALVGRGSRSSGGIPYVGGRSTYGAREPVLRNAAAAGITRTCVCRPPCPGSPSCRGRSDWWSGWLDWWGCGAGVVAGLGFDELPDFPGPFAVALPPLTVRVRLVRRAVCSGCPAFVAGRCSPVACRVDGWCWCGLPGDGVGLPGDGVGLPGDGVGLLGLLRRTDEVDAVGGDPVGAAGLGREREEGGAVERRAGVGAVGGLEGPAEALEAGRRGGRPVGGLGRGLRRVGRVADGWRTAWRTGTRATPSRWRSRSTRRAGRAAGGSGGASVRAAAVARGDGAGGAARRIGRGVAGPVGRLAGEGGQAREPGQVGKPRAGRWSWRGRSRRR